MDLLLSRTFLLPPTTDDEVFVRRLDISLSPLRIFAVAGSQVISPLDVYIFNLCERLLCILFSNTQLPALGASKVKQDSRCFAYLYAAWCFMPTVHVEKKHNFAVPVM